MTITRDESRQIAEDAVISAFQRMGFDTANPVEMQKTMAWADTNRRRSEAITSRIISWFVMMVVAGGAVAGWREALASVFKGHGQ